ncbi:MAG TPA: hypothetical protein DIU35_07735 [Candidatus Latescibacteria bacterium]|nr:hypothetical protein [Candidatus Latescibacterota bacterium]
MVCSQICHAGFYLLPHLDTAAIHREDLDLIPGVVEEKNANAHIGQLECCLQPILHEHIESVVDFRLAALFGTSPNSTPNHNCPTNLWLSLPNDPLDARSRNVLRDP